MLLSRTGFFSFLLALWALFALAAYCQQLSFPEGIEALFFDELLLCLILSGMSILVGNRILGFFSLHPRSVLDDALFSFAIGHGFLSLSVFLLAALHILYPATIAAFLVAFTALALSNYRFCTDVCKKLGAWNPCFSFPEIALIALLGIFVALTLFTTLTPPVSRDALIHHLAVPKLYLENHGLVDTPFSYSSYYPTLLEMLFTIGMAVTSDIAAKLFHFSFYIATLFFTFIASKDILPRPYQLIAVCLFGTLPVVCQVSSQAYVDLGLALYTVGGLTAIIRWHATGNTGWFSLGGVMIGFAVGCKYNGLIVLTVIFAMITFAMARRRVSGKVLVGNLFVFILLVISVNILWMGRNVAYTGNPLYPRGSSIIGKQTDADIAGVSQYHLRNTFYGETGWDQLLLPWNISTKTKSRANYELDGVINPIFLIVLPGLFFVSRKQPAIQWIGYFCLLYFLFFWASSRVRLRYLMPIYPLLSILTAYVFAQRSFKGKKALALTLLFIAFQLNLYWAVVYINSTKPFDFLTGKTNRQAFLRERIPPYPVFEYANALLPQGSRVLFLYGGKFGKDSYYLDHDYVYQSRDLSYPLRKILAASRTPEDVHQELGSQGITHLLINDKLLQFDLAGSLDKREDKLFKRFFRDYVSLECAYGGNAIYRLL